MRVQNIPYPSFSDQDGSLVLELQRVVNMSSLPVTVVLDKEGRVAAAIYGPVDGDHAQGHRPGAGTRVMSRSCWPSAPGVAMRLRRVVVRRHGHQRLAGAGGPGRADRRRRVVLLALRAAAAARLPVLHDGAVRSRHRVGRLAGGPGPDVPGAVLFVLGFAFVFVAIGGAFGEIGLLPDRVPAHGHQGARRAGDRCWAWCSWASSRGSSATCGCMGCRPWAWGRRPCWACCSGSAGRRASGRRSPRC